MLLAIKVDGRIRRLKPARVVSLLMLSAREF